MWKPVLAKPFGQEQGDIPCHLDRVQCSMSERYTRECSLADQHLLTIGTMDFVYTQTGILESKFPNKIYNIFLINLFTSQ